MNGKVVKMDEGFEELIKPIKSAEEFEKTVENLQTLIERIKSEIFKNPDITNNIEKATWEFYRLTNFVNYTQIK